MNSELNPDPSREEMLKAWEDLQLEYKDDDELITWGELRAQIAEKARENRTRPTKPYTNLVYEIGGYYQTEGDGSFPKLSGTVTFEDGSTDEF